MTEHSTATTVFTVTWWAKSHLADIYSHLTGKETAVQMAEPTTHEFPFRSDYKLGRRET